MDARRQWKRAWRGVALALGLSIGVVPSAARAQSPQAEPPRESWQRVEDIVRELGIASGSHVADVGAGGGFFTGRLARAVGAEGRVYAVDVNPIALRELKSALGPTVTNVELVRGDENDPHLPAGRLDAALVVNAYHEFVEYRAMLAALKAALKPGGRLVLVEPAPTRADDTTRESQAKRHTIDIAFAEADLKEAGFEIATRELRFTTRPEHQHVANGVAETIKAVEWLLTARKPGDPSPRAAASYFSAVVVLTSPSVYFVTQAWMRVRRSFRW